MLAFALAYILAPKLSGAAVNDPAAQPSEHAASRDAGWAAVTHTARGWQVAVGALALNAVLIVITLAAPAYQKSLETVDKAAEQRELIAIEVQGGFSALLLDNLVRDKRQGMLSLSDCKSGIKLTSDQVEYNAGLLARMTRQSDIILGRVRLTPLIANHYRRIIDLREGLSSRIRLEKMGRNEDALDDDLRNSICEKAEERLTRDANALRASNDSLIRQYFKPLLRPYGLLDGAVPLPEPITVRISGEDVDYTAVDKLLDRGGFTFDERNLN